MATLSGMSLTETIDNLYTTTWELRKGKAHDNIFTATPFWFWMKSKNKLKTVRGGRFIMEPLEYAKNDNVGWLGRGDSVTLNDYEFLTESKWDWRYLVGSLVRFGVDDQQNRGKAQIMKMMKAQLGNTENSIIDSLEGDLFSTQSGDSIEGMQNLVPDSPSSSEDAGGVDPATYSWFRNQATTMTGLSFAVYGLSKMRTLLNNCMNNRMMDRPDIIIAGQTPYEYYEDEVMEQKQIVNQKLGDAGFENVQFKGIPIVWTPSTDMTERMYFLNTNFLYMFYDPMMNFDMTEWKPIPDQVNDRAAQIVFACAFIVTRRLCQGVLHTIDTE